MAKADGRKRKASQQERDDAAGDQVLGGMAGGHCAGHRASGVEDDAPAFTGFTVPFKDKKIVCQGQGQGNIGKASALVFTHGAGGGMENPATKSFAEGFASTRLPTVSFQGTMNLKNRTQSFLAVIDHLRQSKGSAALALGGRSMGARAAILASQEATNIKGLILVSYPLEGANGEMRDQILLDIPKTQNVLFISGDRDSMCDLKQIADVRKKMKAKTWLVVVAGADHGMSMKPKNAIESIRKETGKLAAQWLKNCNDISTEVTLTWNEAEETSHLQDSLTASISQHKAQSETADLSPPTNITDKRKKRART